MKQLIYKITASESSYASLLLRLTIGIVLWPHGAQLFLGMFGGPGFAGSMEMFGAFGLPGFISFLVIMIQFFGSIMILLGFFTRILAGITIVLFLGMIFKAHINVGFFMNWTGTLQGEGYEYHILAIGILLALTICGAGKYSIDSLINKMTRPIQ